jgi:hypothetical protein
VFYNLIEDYSEVISEVDVLRLAIISLMIIGPPPRQVDPPPCQAGCFAITNFYPVECSFAAPFRDSTG